MTTETYLCPICSLKRIPYGQNCAMWDKGCVGAKTPNATGAWYMRQLVQNEHRLTGGEGVGISAISDENEENAK